jgi:hypothetical protein
VRQKKTHLKIKVLTYPDQVKQAHLLEPFISQGTDVKILQGWGSYVMHGWFNQGGLTHLKGLCHTVYNWP